MDDRRASLSTARGRIAAKESERMPHGASDERRETANVSKTPRNARKSIAPIIAPPRPRKRNTRQIYPIVAHLRGKATERKSLSTCTTRTDRQKRPTLRARPCGRVNTRQRDKRATRAKNAPITAKAERESASQSTTHRLQ